MCWIIMDYTLENLREILRKRLQDEEFDGDTLTLFLNQSLDEILGEDKYPFMQRIDKYTANDHGEINLPLGYASTFYIYARGPKEARTELKFISPEEYFSNTRRHQMVYTVFSNTLFYRLHKTPEEDEGFEITHLYLENPRPLKADTDIPPIPPQYMEILILGALYRAEQVRDNFDFAQIYQNQQDQLLTNMKMRYGPGNLTAQNVSKLPYFGGNYDDRF